MVKWETARVHIDILGISELKWTGMCEFNSDDHYIYYCGQESLRRNGVAIMVNKRVRNAVLGCSLKNDKLSLLDLHTNFPRGIFPQFVVIHTVKGFGIVNKDGVAKSQTRLSD